MVVSPDQQAAARAAALFLARRIDDAIATRGTAHVAVSGGSTPAAMFAELLTMAVRWPDVHVYQVDERVAPVGDADRNLTGLRADLLDHVPAHLHLLYVDPVRLDRPLLPDHLDVVHLGLGEDGHTASLVPGDPVLDVDDRPLALTSAYRGRARVTFTYPVIDAARTVMWLACGSATPG